MPLSYLDRQGTGDMVSRVTTDSDQLNNGLLMVFNQFFVGLLTIFVIIITMARLDLVHDAISSSDDAFVNACGTFYRKEELPTLSQSN